jgi:hypothetical protein
MRGKILQQKPLKPCTVETGATVNLFVNEGELIRILQKQAEYVKESKDNFLLNQCFKRIS